MLVTLQYLLILQVVVILFWYEFDLFASMLLALYSSVFLVIALFIVYFNSYWEKMGGFIYIFDFFVDNFMYMGMLLMPCYTYYYSNYTYLNNMFNWITECWFFKLGFYDYFNTFSESEIMTVSLMHNVLYKFYALETIFLNLYLIFGLFISVIGIYLFKVWVQPNIILQTIASGRKSNGFFFTMLSRSRTISQFRRQVRRKNTSHIKYKAC